MSVHIALRLCLVAGLLAACSGETDAPSSTKAWNYFDFARRFDPVLRKQEEQMICAQRELASLASIPADQTGERLGYHSRIINDRTDLWVQVDLQSPQALDQLVLVPVVLPREQGGIAGYGFPRRFHVELSLAPDMSDAVILADHRGADMPNPGRLPVIIPCHGVTARYIRLTVLAPGQAGVTLSSPLLALAEIMALRGDLNLAAGRPVQAPTSRDAPPVWSLQNLTDSQSILGPPEGTQSTRECGWHSDVLPSQDTPQEITLTWDEPHVLDDVRLFPLRWKGYPHWVGFGFPLRFKVEAWADRDRAPSMLIADHRKADFPNPGLNPVVMPADNILAQRLTLTATRQWERFNDYACALAEVQVFSRGKNIAPLGKITATTTYDRDSRRPWSHDNLLDGNTTLHPILPLDEWLRQIQRSTVLEAALTVLRAAHEKRLTRWRHGLFSGSVTLAALAFVLVGWVALRASLRRRRELRSLRERIARDLHDEVGSNLAGIALLGREGVKHAQGPAAATLAEIQQVAEETAGSMRDLVWMIQPGSPGDLAGGLRQAAERLLRGLAVTFHPPEKAMPPYLAPDFKREVYLIFREALQNIARHSHAGCVEVRLHSNGRTLCLVVVDDGEGFDTSQAESLGYGLTNMRERAKRMGGRCDIQSEPGGGTEVRLEVPW